MLRDPVEPSRATVLWAMVARLTVVLAAGFAACRGYSQTLVPELSLEGTMRLRQTDFAVLEQQKPRNDLPCTVSRIKPELDWNFTFHTGYEVEVSLGDLAGDGNELTVLFRVAPRDRPNHLVYMVQKIRVPAIEEGSKGASKFYGLFTLGEGKFHVDWLMRDRREHVCATSWDLETKLNPKDSQLRPWVPQALIEPPR